MGRSVFITCAITGSGDSPKKSSHVPITPRQIADDALAAADAGASIVHLHARDPKTTLPSRDNQLYKEAVEYIREENSDVILNLTGGMGGDLMLGIQNPLELEEPTDCVNADERIAHILKLKPEIGSVDCGSINFGELLYATSPNILRRILSLYLQEGIKPELEVFELGHIEIAKLLIAENLVKQPAIFQLCLGVSHGAPATPETMLAMRNALPRDAIWAGFGVGKMQMPMVAQAYLLGGHIRVGLEDNLYLKPGILATNEQLVAHAKQIVEALGGDIFTAHETREFLGLPEASNATSDRAQSNRQSIEQKTG